MPSSFEYPGSLTRALPANLYSTFSHIPRDFIDSCLRDGGNIDAAIDYSGTTLLAESIKCNNISIAEFLIAKGADVNLPDSNGNTPLIHAAMSGRADECIDLLIRHGADVNKVGEDKDTALLIACRQDDVASLKLLLSKRANVNAANKLGMTSLQYAAQNGSLECIDLLLNNEEKPDVNAENLSGYTSLIYAAKSGSADCVSLLIAHRAYVNAETKEKTTALMFAAQNGSYECADLLITHEADVDAVDCYGRTALMFAAQNGSYECADLLIDNDANVNAATELGDTALIFAIDRFCIISKELVKKHKAGVKPKNEDIDAKNNAADCMCMLVKCGADVNAKNESGDTPLTIAATNDEVDCLDMLVRYGADVNPKSSNDKAALYCSLANNSAMSLLALFCYGAHTLPISMTIISSNAEMQKMFITLTKQAEALDKIFKSSDFSKDILTILDGPNSIAIFRFKSLLGKLLEQDFDGEQQEKLLEFLDFPQTKKHIETVVTTVCEKLYKFSYVEYQNFKKKISKFAMENLDDDDSLLFLNPIEKIDNPKIETIMLEDEDVSTLIVGGAAWASSNGSSGHGLPTMIASDQGNIPSFCACDVVPPVTIDSTSITGQVEDDCITL